MPDATPPYPNTDWQDHIYRNPSVVQNHNLSVTGGSKSVRYNISLGYVNNPGMIYYTDYKRYQLRTNLDVTIKPWLTVGTNLSDISTKTTRRLKTRLPEAMSSSDQAPSTPSPA